jgi:hypothetical protein
MTKAEIPDLCEPADHPHFFIDEGDLFKFFKVCNDLNLFEGIIDMDYVENMIRIGTDTPYRLTCLMNIVEKFIAIYEKEISFI